MRYSRVEVRHSRVEMRFGGCSSNVLGYRRRDRKECGDGGAHITW